MFKLPNPPSPQAEPRELADFAELTCWVKGAVSSREIIAYLGRIDENDHNFGCEDDDENSIAVDEAIGEIERRTEACGRGYPFTLDRQGTVLRCAASVEDPRSRIYLYLLLSTRLNMGRDRTHAGVDGANLFEEVCSHVLRNYLGGERARSLVFGTALTEDFRSKVDDLCRQLREGSGYRSLNAAPMHTKDGKLDVVAWVPFSDNCCGQLILFSQCKTGTSWPEQVTQLNPDAFIKKWVQLPFAVDPVRTLCLSEACSRAKWSTVCIDAGIVFDRCRLVDFCDGLDPALLDRVCRWTGGARAGLPSW